jgi:phytoene synthase
VTAAPGRPIPGDDRALCRTIIAAHSKSFALASALLPAGLRDDIAATYAFCRRCDDAVDTGPGDPIAAVRRLRAELASIYDGEAQAEPVLGAFQDVVRRRGIPQEYPRELIEGMAMDAMGARYETFDDLDLYCYRAAGVVGLMLCHVMGVRDERALAHATHLGMAMQLTNICRDVREDAARGRRYVPDTLWRPSPGRGT